MKLSPLELRKHQFAKRFRLSGYDPDEVNGFVRQMADQWAEVLEESRRLEDRNRELQGKLSHYEKVELALQEALETSRNTARQVEDNAQRKAELTVEEAELRAQRMLQDAEQERFGIKQDLVRLNSRQSEVAARMRAFLMAEMEVLAQFQGDDPSGFIRLVSSRDAGPAGILAQQATQAAAPDVDAPAVAAPMTTQDDVADSHAAPVASEDPEPAIPLVSSSGEEPVSTADQLTVAAPATATEWPPSVEESIVSGESPQSPFSEPDVTRQDPAPEAMQDPVPEASPIPYSRPPLPYSPPVQVAPPPISEPVSMPPPPPPISEPVSMPPPPPVAPAWPPVEEATIMAPSVEPVGHESVERLMGQTPPPLPGAIAETGPRPTYREMLSGAQSESAREAVNDPFNSSFFESPFTGGEPPGPTEAPRHLPGSDAAQDWSLRTLVTGDGENDPAAPSPSDAERDRIRRILEDLD